MSDERRLFFICNSAHSTQQKSCETDRARENRGNTRGKRGASEFDRTHVLYFIHVFNNTEMQRNVREIRMNAKSRCDTTRFAGTGAVEKRIRHTYRFSLQVNVCSSGPTYLALEAR